MDTILVWIRFGLNGKYLIEQSCNYAEPGFSVKINYNLLKYTFSLSV